MTSRERRLFKLFEQVLPDHIQPSAGHKSKSAQLPKALVIGANHLGEGKFALPHEADVYSERVRVALAESDGIL
jgi:hypothetical protein